MTVPAFAPQNLHGAHRAYGVELRYEPRPIAVPWQGEGEPVHEARVADGALLRVERGPDGDHLIHCGAHRFHLAADNATVVCAPPEGPDPLWWIALLDWVPYCAASLSGRLCLHAAGVAIGGRVLAIAAGSGAGKSTLALALLDAGATFFCDDVLAVEARPDGVVAHPGPRLAKVVAGRPDLVGRLGRPLGRAGEEILVAVAGAAGDPAPVGAVVVLDRSGTGAEPPRLTAEGLAGLRRLVVGLPAPAAGERERFEALAALVDAAPALRLEAGGHVPAATLARHLLTELPGDGERWAR